MAGIPWRSLLREPERLPGCDHFNSPRARFLQQPWQELGRKKEEEEEEGSYA
jgi:hypothetical protein